MTIRTICRRAAVLALVVAAGACNNDEINRPFLSTPVDPLFERYVSMGNSITAGFQSGGINDSTQLQAYPVLLANAMHSPFFPPLLNRVPGAQGCGGHTTDSSQPWGPRGGPGNLEA